MKNNVRVHRTIAGLTQEQLASEINVSRQTIHSIEGGKYIPSTVLALKLAALFRVTVEELFELDDSD